MLLKDIWYFACPARDIKPGSLQRKMLAGEPVMLGRTQGGEAFALRDICPHRAAPLSAGRIVEDDAAAGGAATVECPYHGWRFRADSGACAAIPSLTADQAMETTRIRAGRYPLTEQNGLIWIYIPADWRRPSEPQDGPPPLPAKLEQPRMVEKAVFACHVDHAVVGLMDPAHGPYVHRQWWWRTEGSMHEKQKVFGPRPHGFAMERHKPSSNSFAYKLLGGAPTTEIEFRLPGVRFETIRNEKHTVLGFTAVTPVDEDTTEVTQVFFWDIPLFSAIRPLMRPFVRAFLNQDRAMVDLQQEGLKFGPNLMLIDDADMQAKWYHQLKREWTASREEGRGFVNPVKETTLRWRS
ncbi:MAG: aromatic ring-hydroxylating dioxygenase subunit alpha [Euryhalocaulis sp.]|uniref:aromatic ring-hydroxylating oxygenase subunit alpha n=1 Tax=Euryhalocaulis sp. TaxID=2744307 RepID=UPI0017CD2508|nr:aromatic ring-hydroxylating dioxygenase subunit alpha [Euryhalocaulis sp.]MBA4800914.1 aromatic ring-hydroxylating dioxygenase subunit alpha [Euryhalocaulis sp.]